MSFIDVALDKKSQIAQDTYELTFKFVNGSFTFKAGQYTWLIVGGGRRAFSLASSPADKQTFSIITRASDSEFKKELLKLVIGEKAKVSGAFGSSFVVDPAKYKQLVMIAGGVGLAPFLSIARSLVDPSKGPKMTIISLNYSKDRQFLVDEIKNIDVIHVLGKFEISSLAKSITAEADYFICGTQNLINDVSQKLLKSGVPLERMHFEVSDTGIGIPLPEQQRVFSRFFRASNASVMQPDAFGLGLFITKNIVEQHQGKIGFESTEGKGSRFWFEIPLKS